MSTLERAYALARSGEVRSFSQLKERLKSEGCRAVDALLAPRSLRGHLEAMCDAANRAADAKQIAVEEA
ncbi:hypothetical protein LJR219_001141 [Phenylobacterium sp. LjRoot219]|uniref:hypothetical protein n=1 Tax=Phenylobacterium sp. LjRoot219 TaxID=3342283 RepID=UPI003ECC9AF4